MAEETFVFKKTKYFWKFVNKQFDLYDMNDIFFKEVEEGDYTILLAEQVPANIYSCINEENGCLIEDANGLELLDLQDVYSTLPDGVEVPYFKLYCDLINDGDDGFTISLDKGASDIQVQVGDSQDIYLQGMFLVKRETKLGDINFVLAYATIPNPIRIREFINIPYDGMVVGVGYCSRKD